MNLNKTVNIPRQSFRYCESAAVCKARQSQRGVGLIEVLISLVVLAIGVLAIANLQTASNVAMRNSADYFKLNELSVSIMEQLKADASNAALGAYNTAYTDTGAGTAVAPGIATKLNAWKQSVAYAVPFGEVSIDCATAECLVSMRWYESTHNGTNEEVYNVKSPI